MLSATTSKRVFSFVLLLSLVSSSINLHADAVLKKRVEAINDIDRVVNEGQNQLTKIRICLNSISALVKKNPQYSQSKKDAAVEHLVSLDSMLIDGLKNEKFIQPNLESAYALLNINNALINHIHELVSQDFKNVADVDLEKLLMVAMAPKKGPLKPQEILVRLMANNQKLEVLMKKALGLTWYNKLARQIDEYIITPSQKHSIPSRAFLGVSTAFLASYFAWQMMDDENFEKVMEKTRPSQWLHNNVYGPKPVYGIRDIENAKELKPLGRLDAFMYKWWHQYTPLGIAVGTIVAGGFALEFKNNVYPKIAKWSDVAKNWLKGGNYLKEAERAAEKVEQVHFKDINGQDEILRYMQLLVDYLEDPESFDRLGLTPPKGILCIGDTRTGKTYAISALFGEINDMLKRTGQTGKFKLIKLDVMSIKVEGMEKILRKVQLNAPCIVFIDEIDLLDLQRTGENRTLSEFLTSMSDVIASKDSKKQVIIIAATNRPETLDVALRQPGRFGKELRFEYPNYQDRYKFIKTKVEELSLTSEQFDIAKIARFTENKSYEALNMLIKNAIIKARLSNQLLDQSHLDQALDEDIYHIISKYTKHVPEHELKILAAHFAGQAALLSLEDGNVKLAKVTIKQVMTELKEEVMGIHLIEDKNHREQDRFEYGRIFTHHASDSINMNSKQDKLALCKMYLAGFIAEEMILGSCSYSCHAENDMASALRLAQSIAFEGLDISTMPKHIQKQKHDEAFVLIEQSKKEARELLENNKELLVCLSQELLKHETLDQLQVNKIIEESSAPAISAAS